MDKDTRMSTPIVGGSSLLVIFAALCLTVFALLGLSTVQAGGRLTQTTANAVAAYYEADCAAEEIFTQLRAGELPDGVTKENDIYSYICPVSQTQQLEVDLQKDASGWTVLRWQTVSIAEWETNESINVWDGN